jgi:uncharacterized protein
MPNLPHDFIKTAKLCGIEHALEKDGHFYVEKNKVLSAFAPMGVIMRKQETKNGVEAKVIVKKGAKIAEPLFFCFGILKTKDSQFIVPNIEIQEGAEVKIIAHCSFPHALNVKHEMEALFKIGKNAKFTYEEYHYHGTKSGAVVFPKLNLKLNESAIFDSKFILSKGTVGRVKIEIEAELLKNSRISLETKVLGSSKKDNVVIIDKVWLKGENSKSLIKMRAAAKNGGTVLMQGETYALARGCVGHVDCQEIVVGQGSVARAVPIVEVKNDQARITHEASVGKINQKELETLMTRGLNEDEATELIINALMA